ncbi:hypothetical protein [Geodermatophilus ruber]|uniref:Cell wall-active antibiotics response 4TMS YvqF n=1 Tax=Geodermatophilus ruber TaxID=504800 RepID=A0A1I4KPI3_9ACTN|nr:hypothetical protein [Geodermatophilus ruber]SFL80367.1 hypothetical protein SAMN04488085_11857 [Geodermatophilus ruber]
MRTPRSLPPAVRKLLVWSAVQAVLVAAGRLVARRKDEGDETTAGIRRVRALGEVTLRPVNPGLSRVRLDLVMAGGVLDLTAVPHVPGGIDVTVRVLMGGMAVRVPKDWRVWWHFRGVGGVGSEAERTSDEAGADLRLHVQAVFGGVGIEGAEG